MLAATAQDLAFLVAGKPAFTIPLSTVLNTSITKTEVALEFSSALPPVPDGEDALAKKKRLRAQPDEVSEIRFYLPGTAKGMKKKEAKAKVKAEGGTDEDAKMKKPDGEDGSDDEDESDEDEDDGGETAAQVFHDAVKEKADIGQITGEALCTIPDVLCLTPRGRFGASCCSRVALGESEAESDSVGQTSTCTATLCAFAARRTTTASATPRSRSSSSFPSPTTSTASLSCVPSFSYCPTSNADVETSQVNIDPPIRQGQTRYPYLVMQFIKEEILQLEMNIDECVFSTL